MENTLTKFQPLKADIAKFVEPVRGLTVVSTEDNRVALTHLRSVNDLRKRIEIARTDLVKPLNTRVKDINTYVKEIIVPLDKAERTIKDQMREWDNKERERIRAEQRKLDDEKRAADKKAREEQEQAERAKKVFGDDAPEVQSEQTRIAAEQGLANRQIKTQSRTVAASAPRNTRQDWKCEVLDPELVPSQYKMVDKKAIDAAVRAGARDIPGVRIYPETVVVAR